MAKDKKKDYNVEQKRFLTNFLNGLAVAWYSIGVISPFVAGVDELSQFVLILLSSTCATLALIFWGLKILK